MKRTRNAYHIQIRKNKKFAENLQRNAFFQACLDNKCNIFSLIRKEREATNSIPTVIDGVSRHINACTSQLMIKGHSHCSRSACLY